MSKCGLDFGTSNSTLSFEDPNGVVRLVDLGEDKPETRTALFWDNEEGRAIIGDEGLERFAGGSPGRLIQSPKSFLSSRDEPKTVYGGLERGLGDIISTIIFEFRRRFQEVTGREADSVRLGRPVKFHDTDISLDILAQNRLEKYARNAGFKYIEFELEPVAAARTFTDIELLGGKLLLVADFGGGTSDFSLVNFTHKQNITLLGNGGVYTAGDSIDQALSLGYFSRFLGKGTKFRSGNKLLDIPIQPYLLLSDRKRIHQLNDKKVREHILGIVGALDQDGIDRLIQMTSNPELGYEYLRMLEQSKVKISLQNSVTEAITFYKKVFNYTLSRDMFLQITREQVYKIEQTVKEVITQAGVTQNDIGKVLLIGGTGQLFSIRDMLKEVVGVGKIIEGDTFNAVGKGLSMN